MIDDFSALTAGGREDGEGEEGVGGDGSGGGEEPFSPKDPAEIVTRPAKVSCQPTNQHIRAEARAGVSRGRAGVVSPKSTSERNHAQPKADQALELPNPLHLPVAYSTQHHRALLVF